MSTILYYSNFCEHSKKLLAYLSKSQISKDVHFICIDKRTKGQDGKIYVTLENGQKIVLPGNIEKVPALLLLNNNYQILYGDNIYGFFKPKQDVITRQVTQNNMEPMAFTLGGGCVASDQYSFLDMDADELNTKGNGGVRQMHNYVTLNHQDTITTPTDDFNYKQEKVPAEMTIEKLQQMREQEISNYSPSK
jgi:glutaredoxin-related protein